MGKTDLESAKKRILLIDGDDHFLKFLRGELVRSSYTVECVSSVDKAFERVDAFDPHLILLDIDLKGSVNGFDLLSAQRLKERYVSFIFLSNVEDGCSVVEAFQGGANDYVKKSVPNSELMARVAATLETNDLHNQLLVANKELKELVEQDYLTGLYNMRSMYDHIGQELKRSRRFKRDVACIMIDLDHFKNVNDQNDHLFGSYVLQEFGKILASTVREVDYAARFGGDEFLVVLTEANEVGVETFCERLRKRIEAHTFVDGESTINLTISVGFAVAGPDHQLNAKELVRQADLALYEAKESGRNKVVVRNG